MKLSVERRCVQTAVAQQAVAAAISQASELNVQVAAAVVDNAGNLIAFLRSEGAPYLSIDIAVDKAYTAASFSVSTDQWDELLPEGTALRQGILNRDRFVGFGGGVPIIEDGQCIGAIGVSGATEEQDEICANAGLNKITTGE